MRIETIDSIQKKICLPIVSYFLLTAICVFGREVVKNYISVPSLLFTIVRFSIPTLLLIRAFRYISYRSLVYFCLLEFLYLFSYLFAYIQGYLIAENILDYIVLTCIICIPCCIMAMNINNFELFSKLLLKSSYIGSAVLIVYLISTIYTISYSMSATYLMLLYLLLHIDEVLNGEGKTRWILLVLAVFEFVLILVRGARGPLVCVGAFILLRSISEIRDNKRNVLILIVIAVIILFASQNLEVIINWIGNILESNNISSRNIRILANTSFFEDSGRGYFRRLAIERIRERPIIGYGASSDIYLISAYPHNMLVELLFDFGVFIGGMHFCAFIYAVITVVLVMNKGIRDIGTVFIITGFLMLMLSGTYLQNPNVFIMLGLGINRNVRNHLKHKIKH